MSAPHTGHAATVAFATTGFTAKMTRIKLPEQTREALKTTDITTTNQHTYAPPELIEPGSVELEFYYDPSFSTFPPISSARELLTITYPLMGSETSNATFTATGFVTSADGPEIVSDNNQWMRGTIMFACDGGENSGTEATYTAGS